MIAKPHDRLFRAVFSQPQHATDLCSHILPRKLVAQLDFSTIALQSSGFVDGRLRERVADLLFSIELSEVQVPLYVLLEHQSTFDSSVLVRLWQYTADIVARYAQENPRQQQVPGVVPVVVYHGPQPWPWRSLRGSSGLPPGARQYVPELKFIVDDLTAQSEEALRQREMGAVAKLSLLVLKYGRRPEAMRRILLTNRALIRESLQTRAGSASLAQIFRYILDVSEVSIRVLERLLRTEFGPRAYELFMTTADQLRRAGKAEFLIEMLEHRFGDLPEQVRSQIEQASAEQIVRWGKRAFAVRKLEEVFVNTSD